MGMAASQARLLTITARLADNELRSQTINNAKMRLATETAQASDDYITALNNARMMFRNVDLTGTSQTQLLTYNSMTAFSPYNTQYGLVNSAGLLLVSEDEADRFEKSGNNLEKFLENHGLKWDTTYFDKDKNVIDRLQSYYGSDEFKLVPKPEDYETNPTSAEAQAYDKDPGLAFLFEMTSVQDDGSIKTEKMTADKLRELYESYLRNDFSIERASFNAAQAQYASEKRILYSNAIEDIWDILRTKSGETSIQKIANKLSPSDIMGALGGYYSTTGDDKNNNFVKFENSLNIKEDASGWYLETANKDLSLFSSGDGKFVDADGTTTSGCKVYNIGSLSIYVDPATNKAIGITSSSTSDRYELPPAFSSWSDKTKPFALTPPVDLASALSSITITDSANKKVNYTYQSGTAGALGTITVKEYGSETEVKNLKSAELIAALTTVPDYVDLDTYISISNSSFAQNYRDSRNEYYKLIFDEYKFDTGESADNRTSFDEFKGNYEDLFSKDAGKINIDTMECLNDFTLLIEYVNEYQKTHDGKPAYTSAFQNIIDAFTVELMRDELGEPKYAWVDSTDNVPSSDSSAPNEGNADAKAQWYENLFNRMRKGYAVIEDGLASSADWIEHAFEAGIVTMEQVDKSYNWVSLDYKCCASITEDTDNSAAVAIAEAKYNRAMNDIKRKDNMYDMQLKNIDTEHNALQTEYDVIKGVIAKNIERTMKFDQSA